MTSILKREKLSETPFRKDVLAIFRKHKNAIPLSVVENELKNHNRVTLYRTIKLFLEKGIIHKITLSGAEANYAICKDECSSTAHVHQHIHFKCKVCETIFCVEVEEFPLITLPNYQIDQLEIQASGLCETCNV